MSSQIQTSNLGVDVVQAVVTDLRRSQSNCSNQKMKEIKRSDTIIALHCSVFSNNYIERITTKIPFMTVYSRSPLHTALCH